MYYQNVRWLKTKLLEWKTNLLFSEDLFIAAATQTNLDGSVTNAELCCGNWSMLRRDRAGDRPGGGILLVAQPPVCSSADRNKGHRMVKISGQSLKSMDILFTFVL